MEKVYSRFIEKHGKLTAIQKLSFEKLEAGGNFLITAPTGSGKTEAAVLPLFKRISETEGSGIRILYVTPLRSLNRDIVRRLEDIAGTLGFRAGARHGDTSPSERARQARKAPELLVTTPETLQSILPAKSMRSQMKNLAAVVIDEAHELYHNKRGAQLSIALERLEEISPGYQRIALSATVGNAEAIMSFFSGTKGCEQIENSSRKSVDIKIDVRSLADTKEKDAIGSNGKMEILAEYIMKHKSVLIFGNTRHVVEALGSKLKELDKDHSLGGIGVHHGSLNKEERIRLEEDFKSGKVKGVVATSSLELGIDIGSIDLVVQYGSPRQAIRLMQRVGRSGHGELLTAEGVIIPANPLEAVESVSIINNLKGYDFESFSPQKNALDVMMQQVCGIVLDSGGRSTVGDISRIIGRSNIFDAVSKNIGELIDFMVSRRLIVKDSEYVSATPMTRMFYYDHLSFISDKKKFNVRSVIDNRIVSFLDEQFVTSYLDEGVTFITKGLPWKVLSIEEDTINAEPSSDSDAAVPDWSGEDIPVDRKVAGRVYKLFSGKELDRGMFTGKIAPVSSFIDAQNRAFALDENTAYIENVGEYTVLHVRLGTLANEALGRIISYFAAAKLGHSINSRASPYMVLFELPPGFDIASIIRLLKPDMLETTLLNAIERSELFLYRFSAIAKFFGVLDKDANVGKSMARRLMHIFRGTPVYNETVRELMNNYFDLPTLKSFVERVGSGEIKFKDINGHSLSPLADNVINSAYYSSELMLPVVPDDDIVASFAEYVMHKSADMICTYCGFVFTRKVSELKDTHTKLKCPSCGSPMLSLAQEGDADIIKKRSAGRRLSASEKRRLVDMMAVASLVSEFGWRAAFTLETYGIGKAGAARVLRMLKTTDKSFYLEVLETQRQFIKNRRYWSI